MEKIEVVTMRSVRHWRPVPQPVISALLCDGSSWSASAVGVHGGPGGHPGSQAVVEGFPVLIPMDCADCAGSAVRVRHWIVPEKLSRSLDDETNSVD